MSGDQTGNHVDAVLAEGFAAWEGLLAGALVRIWDNGELARQVGRAGHLDLPVYSAPVADGTLRLRTS